MYIHNGKTMHTVSCISSFTILSANGVSQITRIRSHNLFHHCHVYHILFLIMFSCSCSDVFIVSFSSAIFITSVYFLSLYLSLFLSPISYLLFLLLLPPLSLSLCLSPTLLTSLSGLNIKPCLFDNQGACHIS